jgi:hypothetical protein
MADMETQEKESAVLLLAEWKRITEGNNFLKMQRSELLLNAHNDFVVVREISRRLDVLAENAGIYLIDGTFSYAVGKFTLKPGMPTVCISKTPAEEQQAIQEWLLIKNKK